MNYKSKFVGINDIVTPDFRTGQCSCGTYVQGSEAIWQKHIDVVHTGDTRIDLGLTTER